MIEVIREERRNKKELKDSLALTPLMYKCVEIRKNWKAISFFSFSEKSSRNKKELKEVEDLKKIEDFLSK